MNDPSPDTIVEDYLRRLKLALGELPTPLASQVLEEISAHIDEARTQLQPETEASLRTMLDRLGDPEEIAAEASASLQSEEPDNPATKLANLHRAKRRRMWRRRVMPLAALGVVCVVGVLVGVLASGGASSVSLPSSTPPVVVTQGNIDSYRWFFLAKVSPAHSPGFHDFLQVGQQKIPLLMPPNFGDKKSLCTELVTWSTFGGSAGGGPCYQGHPFNIGKLQTDQLTVVTGLTTLPVHSVHITFADATPPVTAETVTITSIPGFRFFAAPVPTDRSITLITAIGTDNRILTQVQHPFVPPPTSVVTASG